MPIRSQKIPPPPPHTPWWQDGPFISQRLSHWANWFLNAKKNILKDFFLFKLRIVNHFITALSCLQFYLLDVNERATAWLRCLHSTFSLLAIHLLSHQDTKWEAWVDFSPDKTFSSLSLSSKTDWMAKYARGLEKFKYKQTSGSLQPRFLNQVLNLFINLWNIH